MNDYRGWDSDIFTLNVGTENKQLSVPRGILTKIPFFKSALNSDTFTESKDKTFDLPEDDAKAVADVLYFTYTGKVAPIPKPSDLKDREESEYIETYLRAYVVADKYKAETTANGLLDQVIAFYENTHVSLCSLSVLSAAGHQDTPFYDLLMQDMVGSIRDNAFTGGREYPEYFFADDESPCSFAEACHRMSHGDLARILGAVSDPKYLGEVNLMSRARKRLCEDYHKHDLTERCPKATEQEGYGQAGAI